MKIKDVEAKVDGLIEELRKIRDTLEELKDNVADSELDCKICLNDDLKYAHGELMTTINILERTVTNYKEALSYKEEREAMRTLRVYPEERLY